MLSNALLLTLIELLLRGMTMLFQRYLAGAVGAAGLGLLQLVLTVGGFAMTLGLSGLRVTAMYLCAEEYGRQNPGGMRRAIESCLKTGALISSLAGLLLFFLSDAAAAHWIGDVRASGALRLLGIFLPVNCLCAILSGFFTACDRVRELVRVETVERVAGLMLTAVLLRVGAGQDAGEACCAMVLGSSLACLGSTLYQLHMIQKTFALVPAAGNRDGMRARMAKLCVPLALSAYLRSGLVTLEQFLIPWGLARAGGSEEASMAAYGTIHAMVFPILMFPAAILYTVADLLVPELARCRAEENTARIHHLTGTCLRMGLLFALAAACLMGALSGGLGQLIYKNADCGHYLLVFAPSVVMLYLDAMVDGMLKGFGEQTACVRYNVFTSVLDVALLYLLLPRFGMMAYVLTFYFTHAVNFWLSLHRLLRVTGYRLDGKFLPRAVFCALSGLGGSCCLPDGGLLPAMVLRAGLFASVFLLFLEITDTVPAQDRQWLQKSLRLRRRKCG